MRDDFGRRDAVQDHGPSRIAAPVKGVCEVSNHIGVFRSREKVVDRKRQKHVDLFFPSRRQALLIAGVDLIEYAEHGVASTVGAHKAREFAHRADHHRAQQMVMFQFFGKLPFFFGNQIDQLGRAPGLSFGVSNCA